MEPFEKLLRKHVIKTFVKLSPCGSGTAKMAWAEEKADAFFNKDFGFLDGVMFIDLAQQIEQLEEQLANRERYIADLTAIINSKRGF